MSAKATASPHALPLSSHLTEHKPAISDAETRQQRIAWLAYSKAEKRGFEPGYELEDWLEAEKAEVEVI